MASFRIVLDEDVVLRVRDDVKLGRIDHRFHLRKIAAQVGIIMMIDQALDLRGPEAGAQNLEHDIAEVVTAAAVDQHSLVSFYDQIRVAVQAAAAIGISQPVDSIGDFDRIQVLLLGLIHMPFLR